MGDALLSIGLTVGFTGLSAKMQLKQCEIEYPDINPYEECLSSCEIYKNNKIEYEKCINKNRCNDIDPFTKEKIYKNYNIREQCKKEALSNKNMQYDLTALVLTKELIEGVVLSKVAKQLGLNTGGKKVAKEGGEKAAKGIISKAKSSVKAAISGAKSGARAIGVGVSRKIGQTYMYKIIAATTAKVITRVAASSAGKVVVTVILKILGSQAAKILLKLGLLAAKVATKLLGVALGLMTLMDGISIVLDIWDPAGFNTVPKYKDIKKVRDAYLKGNKSYLDNKLWVSELYKEKKEIALEEYEYYKNYYSNEKTKENEIFMNESKKKLDEATELYNSHRFYGYERPREHGGILVYPLEAYPSFPYDDNLDFMNKKLEELWYKYIREYISNQKNLVWKEEDLFELIEIQKEKDEIEKSKQNSTPSELNEKSNSIKNKINEKEEKINEMIKNKKLPEQIENERSKLQDLKDLKSNIDESISDKKSEEISNIIAIQNNNATQNNRQMIVFALLFIIMLFVIYYYYY